MNVNTRAVGKITFLSAASVFGIVEGKVIQQSYEPLQVGKTGWVSGSIISQGTVFIEGRVEGDITSETKGSRNNNFPLWRRDLGSDLDATIEQNARHTSTVC